MRITENTPARLALRERMPMWLSVGFLATAIAIWIGKACVQAPPPIGALALFGLFAVLSLHASDVIFDKVARTCEVRRLDFFWRRVTRLAFDDIADVKLEADYGGESSVLSYRVCLVTARAKLPLTLGYSTNLHRHMAMRDAIQEALTAPSARA